MSTGEKASPIFPSAIGRAYDLLVAGVSAGHSGRVSCGKRDAGRRTAARSRS